MKGLETDYATSPSPWERDGVRLYSRQDKMFIGIIILVHLVYFLLACMFRRIYMGDSFEYIYEAVNIKDLGFFYSGNVALPIQPEYMTQRQPAYPLLLMGVYLFTVNNWLVLVLQNIISIFNIWYLRRVLQAVGYNNRYDWLLLLLVAAYPAQFINANTIAPDILLQACVLLYFGGFVAWLRSGSTKHAGLMSVALAVGMLVKPVLYPFVWLHPAILLVAAVYKKARFFRLLPLSLLPAIIMLLYSYWNCERTGKFHFSSNQAFNASFYYYPFISQMQGADSAGRFLSRERASYNAIPEFGNRYDYANEQGIQFLKQNFVPYMAFHLRNSARIFIEPGKAEMDLFTGRLTYGRLYSRQQTGLAATWKADGVSGLVRYAGNNPSLPLVLLVLLFNLLRLAGFIYFCCCRGFPVLLRLFVGALAAYFAIAAGPIANTRYFLPVSLIVTGTAVLGMIQMHNRRQEKRIAGHG